MEFKRLGLTSAAPSDFTLEALRQLVPSAFTEVREGDKLTYKVDFDHLREMLGDAIADADEERYGFYWVGKQDAKREAAKPTRQTLRPVEEESVAWESTQNLYIEGDNLEVLKLLQTAYIGKVKMIYIDPPYNTGNDFVYNDDFAMSREEQDEAMGNLDEEGNRLRRNLDSNPRYHSDWCSMIYSRLLVARTLLSNDGVIFISIDDNEVHNLRKICDEVFGAPNFVGQFTRVTKKGGKSSDSIAKNHDFIVVYAKQLENADLIGVLHDDEGYSLKDDHFNTRGYYKLNQTLDYDSLGYVASLDYPITIDGEVYYAGGSEEDYLNRQKGNHGRADWAWRWSQALYNFGYENDFIVVKKGGKRPRIYTKIYQKVTIERKNDRYEVVSVNRTKPLSTLEFTENKYSNDNAKKKFDELMKRTVFEYTKPTSLISRLASLQSDKNSLILDFFSGSATTAHAVMQLNAEDGGKRKYIMVQLPEKTPEGSEAHKAGYDTICEIGKERIRRAGRQIKEGLGLLGDDLDIGFRVLRLDSSNMEEVYFEPGQISQASLFRQVDSVKKDRTPLDLLFGCMVDWGVELSLPIRREEVSGKELFVVNDGALVACFEEEIPLETIRYIAGLSPQRLIFRESSFATDADKLNVYEQFKQLCSWSEEESYRNIRVI